MALSSSMHGISYEADAREILTVMSGLVCLLSHLFWAE